MSHLPLAVAGPERKAADAGPSWQLVFAEPEHHSCVQLLASSVCAVRPVATALIEIRYSRVWCGTTARNRTVCVSMRHDIAFLLCRRRRLRRCCCRRRCCCCCRCCRPSWCFCSPLKSRSVLFTATRHHRLPHRRSAGLFYSISAFLSVPKMLS